ncbi:MULTISPECIES: hypothetical protein [Cyanophyceae]|uniref:hypothetical protein n=1 Tax=Cyanophyceae TaxID=3028117 RepID=UPI00232B87A7|nr:MULTISPECIES: hypothetical protein [Cyanophyceae]MDB9357078.1 hypothetical protein [Nodularia spumigena CS-587/03]MDB9303145.1 hypothetical protein [Nodularia spumigena CS-591/12]MDB9319941.1 hypothetical protein [Nodularia spumigena CS-590/01A]MDB9321904.1 hypothetical protein [Nodularia spumigena CS-591/07A]MDB9325457.1 hypothetical protein [Nodularia spumigena CS-590/02]
MAVAGIWISSNRKVMTLSTVKAFSTVNVFCNRNGDDKELGRGHMAKVKNKMLAVTLFLGFCHILTAFAVAVLVVFLSHIFISKQL